MSEVDVVNLETAGAAHLDGLDFADDKKIFAVVRVNADELATLISEHGAVLSVRQAGGTVRSWQTVGRLALDLYANGYTNVWAAQSAVESHLGRGWKPNTRPGEDGIRIDSWRNESAANEQPYTGGITVVTSIWRVTTRHQPA